MAKVISIGLQKGGVSKTTTSAILSYLLSKEAKVLAVDFDSQGNLTEFLTQKDIFEFDGKTIYEACEQQDPVPFIYKISDSLHLLPADEMLGLYSNLVRGPNAGGLLSDTLEKVKDQYDYIIIDMAPQLGDATASVLYASDFTFSPILSEPLSYKTISRYLEFVSAVQIVKPTLVYAGILLTMFDPRTSIDLAVQDQLFKEHKELMFKTVIKKRTRIKEFSLTGIEEKTKAGRIALEPYKAFLKELKAVVRKKKN